MRKLIIIVGTNASGKSALAVQLAKEFDGEVISADSRQVYKTLDIATGKISQEEMDSIPHHMIDIVEPSQTYTAADFARDGAHALEDIWKRRKVPIIAGGTGFYIECLLNPSLLPQVPPNEDLRRELEVKDTEDLFNTLLEHDTKRAYELELKGEHKLKRRLIRAIEIATSPLSKGNPLTKGVSAMKNVQVLWIGIHWDDEKLKERIHQRTLERIENGMIEEAQKLHKNGLSWQRMYELGLEYGHMADFLQNKISHEELVARIDRDDWRYAKRQRTWFKRNKDIQWFKANDLENIKNTAQVFLAKTA